MYSILALTTLFTALTHAIPIPRQAVSTSSRPKYVVAHHMVGNTFPYQIQDWADDIALASQSGIDGFALNMGQDDWQPARVADAYQAALQSGLDFKLFLSLDMTSLPCASPSDAQALRSLVLKFASHPNQLRYTKLQSDPLPLVSTFAGETCTFGQDTPSNGWRSQFTQSDDLKGKITFVPSFFIDPATFKDFDGVMDGDFNWNGGWPVELTTASAGSSSTSLSSALTNLLGLSGSGSSDATNIIPHLSALGLGPVASVGSDPNPDTQSKSVASTIADALSKFIGSPDTDLLHVQGLSGVSPSSSRKRDGNGDPTKVYMASVSPWFFTHFGADTFNKNFLYVADQHLYAKRWESLISASTPASSDPESPSGTNTPDISSSVDIVEIISWNDYGESHYVGPIKGAQPPQSEEWTKGMEHTAWLPLTAYYAAAFKTGQFPNVTKDDEKLFMWSRPHPAQAQASGDGVGDVLGKALPEDTVWGITLLSEPASVTFEVYPSSGNANGTVLASQTFQATAGLTKLAMPISVPDGVDGGSVSVRARVVRSSDTNSNSNTSAPNQARADGTVMELDAGSQGFAFVKNPEKFNYNAWVGCVAAGAGAGVGCGTPNTTTTSTA